jgi:hypothetical protein
MHNITYLMFIYIHVFVFFYSYSSHQYEILRSRCLQNLFGTFFILIVQSSYKVAIFRELGHDLWCQFLLFTSFASLLFFWEHSTTLMLRNTHILLPLWTHACTHTLPLWAPLKDRAGRSWGWRSHHRRLAVDRHITYHWKNRTINPRINPGKCKHPYQI